jgi:hypothetical protein
MPPPAEQELTQGTDHVYHEIRSLLAGLELPPIIKNLVPNDVYEGTESLVLEARLLHARNLIAFFAEHHYKDDLIARDYGFPYQPLPIKKDEVDRLHKELAHLSRKCGPRTEETKEWHYDDLERPLLTRCEQSSNTSSGTSQHSEPRTPSLIGNNSSRSCACSFHNQSP